MLEGYNSGISAAIEYGTGWPLSNCDLRVGPVFFFNILGASHKPQIAN